MISVLRNFISNDLMPSPDGLRVWDLGCGDGTFSAAFADMGAKEILATDLQSLIPPARMERRQIRFRQGGFDEAVEAFGVNGQVQVDLVFMHLMTEHVTDLRTFLRTLAACIEPGTQILLHHGSYYQPVGHHDFGFLCLDEATWKIAPRGVRCWEAAARCAASASDRQRIAGENWFHWSDASEATRNPDDCAGCNYFRRSKPWAHLLYGDDYSRTFPEVWFRDQLNRATSSQVRWLAQEAGFSVIVEHKSYVMNEVPDDLASTHGAQELSTYDHTLRATRL